MVDFSFNLIALAELFQVSVEYLATGKVPRAQQRKSYDPTPLLGLSVGLFIAVFFLFYIGTAFAVYMPVFYRDGFELRLGDSVGSILYMVVHGLCLVAAITLLIVYFALRKKEE